MSSPEPPLKHPLPSSDQVLVHFYRAVVGHADVWRQRMDATTNWAVATTAVMMTFTFSNPQSPHFVLLIALAFDSMFLLMESRRYQTYDLWRRRFRTLNRYMIAPTLLQGRQPSAEVIREQYARIAADLGRTVPHLSVADAVGFRIRRNYGFLYSIALLAWGLKLEIHPAPAQNLADLILRAAVGSVPGSAVFGVVGAFIAAATFLGVRAPSERMLNWSEVPSPLGRWLIRSIRKTRRKRRNPLPAARNPGRKAAGDQETA
ncbi:hypothetical protein BH23GEM7_BH23GEM7_42190 [soil metagenome]